MSKTKTLWLLWGAAYGICTVCGFFPVAAGALYGLFILLSLGFFVPPALLLFEAVQNKQPKILRIIRNLSLISLDSDSGIHAHGLLSGVGHRPVRLGHAAHDLPALFKEEINKNGRLWSSVLFLIQHFHDLTAAAGDHLTFLHMEYLVADGAIHIPLFFCLDDGNEAFFQFHGIPPLGEL